MFIRVEDEDGNDSDTFQQKVEVDIAASISPAFREVAAAGGTVTFNVTNNRTGEVKWAVSENVNWLSVSPVSGKNSGNVTVSYDANQGAARTGVITFSVNGTKVQKFEVRQAGASVQSACSSDGVAEAISGFTWPLPYNFSNNGGYSFKDKADDTGTLIYHPGEDWNVPDKPGGSCDGDLGLNVVAVADGKVVYANPDSWGGVVILHNYQNNIWYSQYGHVQNIKVSTKGPKNTVKKGDVIAEIGKKGDYAPCAHLHFEIRKFNHPEPCNGAFWSNLGNINNVLRWYESPKEFISANLYHAISIETLGDRKDGNLKIVSLQPNGRTAGFGSSGRVVINGISVASTWNNDGIRLNNIYSAIALRWDDLLAPLHFEIFDKKGNKIANTYYPFNDIGHAEDACSESWYRRPVMKLWKEGIVSGYTDGNRGRFGSGNATSRAELVKMVVGAASAGNLLTEVTVAPFADVPADTWHAKYITYAKEKGWVQGCDTDKNLFCPNDSINRADAAKIISKALQPQLLEEVKSGRKLDKIFPDVTDSGEWYYPYVYTLQAAHAVQGFSGDGTFRPHDITSRAQLAKMVCVAGFGEIECTCMDAK
ncbi:MAG: S-layer homology domain-containing protein [Candidatus Electronema sp. V4]|uniref:S-layer homology domain-containing protein n=1 Tax=Candidatus Electronema sp. V4 TaxID=3454756 RepID=UPI0040554AE4